MGLGENLKKHLFSIDKSRFSGIMEERKGKKE
jgi:hypothetical protein